MLPIFVTNFLQKQHKQQNVKFSHTQFQVSSSLSAASVSTMECAACSSIHQALRPFYCQVIGNFLIWKNAKIAFEIKVQSQMSPLFVISMCYYMCLVECQCRINSALGVLWNWCIDWCHCPGCLCFINKWLIDCNLTLSRVYGNIFTPIYLKCLSSWSAWSSGTTLCQHQSPGDEVVQTVCTWSVVGPSTFMLHGYGMHCLKASFLCPHCQHSCVDLKPGRELSGAAGLNPPVILSPPS